MAKLIILGVLLVILIVGMIFATKSYKNMLNVYRRFDNEFVYCNLSGYQFACYAIDKLKLKTKIAIIKKELSECYLPKRDVVCLSEHIANTSSVSSICITAHELGHAVQNKKQSGIFILQSCLDILGKLFIILGPFLIITGIVLLFIPNQFDLGVILLLLAFGSYFLTYIFKIFTIPMEMQASKIAYNFLKDNNILSKDELKHGKKVLDAAIGTYVASLFIPFIKLFKGIGNMFKR